MPAPWAFVELQLCKLYHCTPSQLDREDPIRILRGLYIENETARIENAKHGKHR